MKTPIIVEQMSNKSKEKYEAQKKYCLLNNSPFFTELGKCYYCNKLIFGENISLEACKTKLITRCKCGHSFCE